MLSGSSFRYRTSSCFQFHFLLSSAVDNELKQSEILCSFTLQLFLFSDVIGDVCVLRKRLKVGGAQLTELRATLECCVAAINQSLTNTSWP